MQHEIELEEVIEERIQHIDDKVVSFPDPSRHHFFIQILIGMSYSFYAIKICLTDFYSLFSLVPALLISITISVSLSLGIFTGIIIIQNNWKPIPVCMNFSLVSKTS